MSEKEKILSASRIKTLEVCSYSYYANYLLRIPQRPHPSTEKGTITHLILELLLKKRHFNHYELIMKRGAVEVSEAIKHLIIKNLKKCGFDSEENRKDIYDWVFNGLNHNFFGEKGAEIQEPEKEFLLESESPKYKLRGLIDKSFLYKDSVTVVDFKSSKRRFSGDDLTGNIQALSYVLAAKKLWPHIKKVIVEFLFLRFPKKPSQIVEFDSKELSGFEAYLAYCYDLINNFDEKMAHSNFAADKEDKKNLCHAKTGWECPYLRELDYWVLLDNEGVIKQSSLTEIPQKEGFTVEKRHYDGCPKWKNLPPKGEASKTLESSGGFF